MRKRHGSAADCNSTSDAIVQLSGGLGWSDRLPFNTLHELLRVTAMTGDLDHARQGSTCTLCSMNGILLVSLRSGTSIFQQVSRVTGTRKH